MLSVWLNTHQWFVISEHKTHGFFEKIKYIKIINAVFQKIVHRVKRFTFWRQKLKTKEKKKTEIKRGGLLENIENDSCEQLFFA